MDRATTRRCAWLADFLEQLLDVFPSAWRHLEQVVIKSLVGRTGRN